MQRFTLHIVSLVVCGALTACGRDAAREGPRPNLVLLVVDTLRADRLGCYGNPRPTSPRLDALARAGFLFERACSSAPWTAPALATLFTGTYPDAHGVRRFPDPPRLNDALPTLAQVLRAEGYATAAFTGGGYAKADFGFGRGFEHYERQQGDDESNASNLLFPSRLAANVDKSIRWLEAHRSGPFFLFVHTYEPHFPYYPTQERLDAVGAELDLAAEREALARVVADWNAGRALDEAGLLRLARHVHHCDLVDAEPVARRRELDAALAARGLDRPRDVRSPLVPFLLDLYDAEVATADAEFGRVLDALDELGVAEDTIVVLASDHGESFGEHGELGHGSLLSEVVLRIALVIRAPAFQGGPRRVEELASSADVLPTLLELMAIEADDLPLQGRSLVPAMRGEALEGVAFSHATAASDPRASFHSLRDARWSYLAQSGGPGRWLFDLEADPGETRDVRAAHPEVAARLEALLEAQREADAALAQRFPPVALEPGGRDPDLEQLGYVGREDDE